ncbi:zinc finger protein 639-like [Chironomus tepperi]|uniref:zinc finger protein 639-like n=1 Tax=Chironomus tepperi TaxID=113505 RepID=UPI00391F085B
MTSEEESSCRICADDAHYNIFQDELVVENRNMKIYIVLNNFIFEKLYGPDEFSDMVCMTCCDALFNSYKFMLQVREAEQKLRTEGPPQKKMKIQIQNVRKVDIQQVQKIDELAAIADAQDDLMSDNNINEDIMDPEYSDEEIVVPHIKEEKKEPISPEKRIEPARKKPKLSTGTDFTESFTITSYSLVYKNESEQTIANIHIDNGIIKNVGDGNYELDKWLENTSDTAIYSCTYCVKGFVNSDFLLKHITACHICLTCFKICDTNKQLNQHVKTHNEEKLVCPFCGKVCTYNVFRQHIRKQHVLNLPYYVGVLPQNINARNYE